MLTCREPAERIAAVLHDAVEDTDLELHDLVEAGYQADVITAIDATRQD